MDIQRIKQALIQMSQKEREELLNSLLPQEAEALLYDWELWGRPDQQLPKGDWETLLILAGRGWGKTRTGAEHVKKKVNSGEARRIAIIAPTAADARDVMVMGVSGLLSVWPSWQMPKYEPSNRRIVFWNGAQALIFSADEPERLRGPQFDFAWCDELCSWRYVEAFDMLEFGLRLGKNPQCIITTTPKPTQLIKTIYKDPGTKVITGSTFDNAANLAEKFIKRIRSKYEGTRLGEQELYARILDDNPGALWTRALIENGRVKTSYKAEDGSIISKANKELRDLLQKMRRIVVAVDPAISNNPDSDETGIVVCGLGDDGFGYVLGDFSMRGTPNEWAQTVCRVARSFGADRVVAEVNQGGQLVESILRTVDSSLPYKAVHASKGKFARAEPISALYEQGRVKHFGVFATLEDQMCDYNPQVATKSPDRLDALVWGFTELFEQNGTGILDWMGREITKNSSEEKAQEFKEKQDKIRAMFRSQKKGE